MPAECLGELSQSAELDGESPATGGKESGMSDQLPQAMASCGNEP
jgi:hypothetical protein